MSGETAGINPEDLIVQKGPDRGRIKDLDLAQVGAEAEDKARTEKNKIGNRIKSFFGQDEAQPDTVANSAMRKEVVERAQARGENPYDAEKSFSNNLESKERLQKIARREITGTNTYPQGLVVQEGEDAGRIEEVELARVGAEAEDAARRKQAEVYERARKQKNPDVKEALNRVAEMYKPEPAGNVALHTEVLARGLQQETSEDSNYDARTDAEAFTENQVEKEEEGKSAREKK